MNGPDLDRLRSEGELNISPRRQTWHQEQTDESTKHWLEADAKYFLRRSPPPVSTWELVRDGKSGDRATDLAEEVMYRALAKGLSFKLTMGNILTLTPPLTLTREEMDQALDILDTCLTEVESAG